MTSTFLIDAHCHLTDERVIHLNEQWIQNAKSQGVLKLMIGGLDPADWQRQKKLKELHPKQIITSFGLHPWWIEKLTLLEIENAMKELSEEIQFANAVGETGLDFHPKRNPDLHELQESVFKSHLSLAITHQKPLVLHLVRSHARALQIVKEMKAESLPILLHSFSGSKETAREWVKLGAVLSFSGGFLKEGTQGRTQEVILETPLSQLLFETDSPDQAWRPDGLNEPCYVREIYEKAALLKGIPLSELMQKVAENFRHFG